MKKCQQNKNLYFYLIGELDERQVVLLEKHLSVCATCQKEKDQLMALLGEYTATADDHVDEATLCTLRNVVSLKLKTHKATSRSWIKWRPLFVPVQYAAATIIMIVFGFVLGRMGLVIKAKTDPMLQNLLTGEQQIQAYQSNIIPYLANVDKVKYDPQTGQLEIKYNTINDIQYRGDVQSPTAREVLRHAMLEEGSPSVRMQAVKAVGVIAEQNRSLEPEFLQALEYLLHEEQNSGVRLMALRVLKSVPLNDTVKNVLLRIILYDKNTALRIQAFETLTGNEAPKDEIKEYLQVIKHDTSSYIRYKADKMLKQIESENNKPKIGEISREG